MIPQAIPSHDTAPAQAILAAGGIVRSAAEGQTAFSWQGAPGAFVLLTEGALAVEVRTKGCRAPWIACRAEAGEDCLPVTAAILAGREIAVRATCAADAAWVELPPAGFLRLLHEDPAFRQALFASHLGRAPGFLSAAAAEPVLAVEHRLAGWLLDHAKRGTVAATHGEIAADLLTAREVVSRKLRAFALRGWIVQDRGVIRLDAPAALARLSRGGCVFPGLVRQR
ncbi:MAG: Crp/Fnr family transcriptional regulator [Roseicyclus sp.]